MRARLTRRSRSTPRATRRSPSWCTIRRRRRHCWERRASVPTKPLELAMFVSQGLFPSDVSVGEVVANALTAGRREGGDHQDRGRIVLGCDAAGSREHQVGHRACSASIPANASGLYHLASLFKSNKDDAARPDVWNMGRYRNPEVDRLLDAAGTRPIASRPAARSRQGADADLERRAVYLAADQRERLRAAQAGERRRGLADPVHQRAARRRLIRLLLWRLALDPASRCWAW